MPLLPVPPEGNGLAIAGFVLGIVAVVCGFVPFFFVLTWILAALGLAFGIAGLARSRRGERKPHRALAIAAIALSSVAIPMGVVGAIVTHRVVDELEENIRDVFGPADPDSYDLGPVRCDVGGAGRVIATGRITNTTSHARGFGIKVTFGGRAGGVEDTGMTYVFNVPPGGSSDWRVETTADAPAGTDCNVVTVTNF